MTIPPAAVIALRALSAKWRHATQIRLHPLIAGVEPGNDPDADGFEKLGLSEQAIFKHCADDLDALVARVEPQVMFIDPSSVQGQRAIRNAAFLTPTTQGDPVPDSAEDVESHPWKAAAHEVPDWLLDRLRAALNEARITISVDHPARVQVEAAMADLDFYRTM